MSGIDFGGIDRCIDDARRAALEGDAGPGDPTEFGALRGRLEASRLKLPPLYRETFFSPYAAKLSDLGPSGFTEILLRDPAREGVAGLMFDLAHAILQNGEAFEERATDGFQEVVSDLYDGFLSAEDRRGVKPPDEGVVPPLVKWGNPDFGPYTWPVDATAAFGVDAAVVSLPPANARHGLFAWAALGHETAGHDILHADTGLRAELARKVRAALAERDMPGGLPDYWASRIDETASDVLGILNMGPAAGIGLVVYFRGLRAAFTGIPKLGNSGPAEDPHPADILRGFLAGATVELLGFDDAADWAAGILAETEKDLRRIVVEGSEISPDVARESAAIVARTLARERMAALEDHALGEIQDWRNVDEEIVRSLRAVLESADPLPPALAAGTFAAHVVASAVTAALAQGADLPLIFQRTLAILKKMHDANPSWGPLFVAHPSTIARHVACFREAPAGAQIVPAPRAPAAGPARRAKAPPTRRRAGASR